MKYYKPPTHVERFISLIYGQTGTEKTFSIRTFPSPLVLDFEDRLTSLHGQDVKVLRPETYPEVISILNDPDYHVAKGMAEGQWEDDVWRTLVVDSLTAAQYGMFLSSTPEAFSQLADPSLEKAITSSKWDVRRNYALATARTKSVVGMALEAARRKGAHVVIICHEAIDKDEMSGSLQGGPLLMGRMPFQIPHLFDFVLRYAAAVVDGKPCSQVQTKTVGVYHAKDALGCLDLYEPPDFRIWAKKIGIADSSE